MLQAICKGVGARTALDLFTGTTRVAQAFKRAGAHVTAVDVATYSEILAKCYVALDADSIDREELQQALDELAALPARPGYFTETFCERSRFFQPENGARVDAIRERIERDYVDSRLYPVLLTSLMEAADRVDSTTGVQMAYVKRWSKRSFQPLELRMPALISGTGAAVRMDARAYLDQSSIVDVAYLDPPYNQHRYYTNYHIWETLVRWDAPEHYGVACKRMDCRDDDTKSVFNKKREMPLALEDAVAAVRAKLVVLSYNDESWITRARLEQAMAVHGHVETLEFDSKRYVGAQIGIYNPDGKRVGQISHLRNTEYVILAGEAEVVAAARNAVQAHQDQS